MGTILMGQAAYKRLDHPEMRLRNMMFERTPANVRDQVSLVQCAGLSAFCDVGAADVDLIYRQAGTLDGLVVVISNQNIYSFDPADASQVGTAAALGIVGRPVLASGGSGIVYFAGAGLTADNNFIGDVLKTATIDDGTASIIVSNVTFPDSAKVADLTYINGYFIFVRGESQAFYWLNPGETVIDGLDYASAETSPDGLVASRRLGDELVNFGQENIEPWYPTGDGDFPFARIQGRSYAYGLANRNTVVELDGALLFVGSDRIVYRYQGQPTRISDHFIEEQLKGVDFTAISAWCYGDQGHLHYALTIEGKGTFCFDLSTQTWWERSSHLNSEFKGRTSCALGDGRWLVAGETAGAVYVLDAAANDDAGAPLERIFTGLVEVDARTVCASVGLDCTVGAGPTLADDPQIALRWSDDDCKTWSDWQFKPLGRLGEYQTNVVWRRLGQISKRRVFQWRVTDPVNFTVRRAWMNEGVR